MTQGKRASERMILSVGTWYESSTVGNNSNVRLSNCNGIVLNNASRGNGFERCSAKGKQLQLWHRIPRRSIVRGDEVNMGDCTANAILLILFSKTECAKGTRIQGK